MGSPNTIVGKLQVNKYRVERVTLGQWQTLPSARGLTREAAQGYYLAALTRGLAARIVTDDERAVIVAGPGARKEGDAG
jgi:hypothetical protein